MKLLKPVLISFLFLNTAAFATQPKTDTIRHRAKKEKLKFRTGQMVPPGEKMYYNDCVFTQKQTIAQRLKHYPFLKAVKIVAVSYPWAIEPVIGAPKLPDSVFLSDLHVENGKLNYTSIKEKKTLNQLQINALTNIIYNTTYKRKNHIHFPGFSCYSPRNALLFYDKNGNIFDYIEICFQCQGVESLSKKITIGTYCNQKYDLLRQFFIDAGIKYGTTKDQ